MKDEVTQADISDIIYRCRENATIAREEAIRAQHKSDRPQHIWWSQVTDDFDAAAYALSRLASHRKATSEQ